MGVDRLVATQVGPRRHQYRDGDARCPTTSRSSLAATPGHTGGGAPTRARMIWEMGTNEDPIVTARDGREGDPVVGRGRRSRVGNPDARTALERSVRTLLLSIPDIH